MIMKNKLANQEVYDYVVVLKNDHKKTIEKTGWLLSIFLVLLLGVSIYIDSKSTVLIITLISTASLLISNRYESNKKKDIKFKNILIIGGIGLIAAAPMPILLGVLFLVCGLIEKTILQKREFGFSKTTIQENGLLGKKIKWNELNRVILKDDVLTIDYKNNKIFQAYIDDEEDDDYDVGPDEFNAYCQNCISQA
jgi:hypothetical protein